ncbi:DUF397 domain-containing protein [Actinomadura logoneensis]|uniref:DUF397 domain-containing protein n=1 Tax=Actinomadura logoneensis TaxID=2293572 RepID=A0A372J9M0_9ACTN|nr:DUF397 domain-containing protein [Actinomadura logoneensis]RFU36701.1 DUF397 domain-containing protein [Actinomadura logoneensis]
MNPVELSWRKSTHSQGGGSDCVEVAASGTHLFARDSKDATGSVLSFGPDAWRAFTETLKRGDLDL